MNLPLGAIPDILSSATPLLFAALGALISEYAGVLAVFMDGAITLSGFIAVALTIATGNPALAFAGAAIITVTLMFLVARFTELTGANPFLTGLAVNFLATGITSLLSVSLFGTRGVVTIGMSLPPATPSAQWWVTIAAFAAVPLVALFLSQTVSGLNLRVTGSDPDLLAARGVKPERYRALSWCAAAFFASCAGATLAFDLSAYAPGLSAGRGWTALAAVYLGYKKPGTVMLAVLVFAAANWFTNGLQGSGSVPGTLILGLPYALALVAFVLIPPPSRLRRDR